MHTATYADWIRPRNITNIRIYDILLVLTASFLLSLSARIAVQLPFSPVPVTAQTFAVLVLGAILGRKRAVSAVLIYLVQGISGLPVFAGGNAGFIYLTGLTGGYLIGFIPAVYLCGYLAERRWDRHYLTSFLLFVCGSAIIYVFGTGWLALFTSVKFALTAGFYPFLPGDLLKICLAVAILPYAWKMTKKINP